MTDSLVQRLREAIDETERIARAAVGFDYGVKDWADDGDPVNVHIARHDPAAVLRRCAADRKILDLHRPAYQPIRRGLSPDQIRCAACLTNRYGYSDDWEPDPWPCPTVLALAEYYEIEA